MKKSDLRVGLIGAGNAGMGHLLRLERMRPGCAAAFCDPDRTRFDEITSLYLDGGDLRAAGDLRSASFALRPELRHLPHYVDLEEMLQKENIDLAIIASPDHAHAENVRTCVRHGVNILLEKPIAITRSDVEDVYKMLYDYPKVVTVNFSLRGSAVTESVRKYLQSGTVGKIISVQWTNHVPYGDVYFRNWMRTSEKVGSLLLQKATHDIDLINYFVNDEPTSVYATGSRSYYGGNLPNDLTCDECDLVRTCPMSLHRRHLDAAKPYPPRNQRLCVFAREIDIDDNHQLILRYPCGISASYTQTFLAPAAGACRGGTVVGTEGILEFHFYDPVSRNPERSSIHITRWDDRPQTTRREVYDTAGLGHFGSSEALAEGLLDLLQGKSSTKNANIRSGYVSALTCLAAQDSIETGQLQKIHYAS